MALEKLKKDKLSSYGGGNRDEYQSPSYNNRDSSNNYGPTLNSPFGSFYAPESNQNPTPTASWYDASSDQGRYSNQQDNGGSVRDRFSTGGDQGFDFFKPRDDPFEQMAKDFDNGNEEWISTISKAFEGFQDFKKIDRDSDQDTQT